MASDPRLPAANVSSASDGVPASDTLDAPNLPLIPPHDGQLTTAPPLPDLAGEVRPDAAQTVVEPTPTVAEGIIKKRRRGRDERQLLTGRAARGLADISYSPGQLAWRQLKRNRVAMLALRVLVVLYTVAIFAPFIAPYDPQDQQPGGRDTGYHPPMRLRWRDREGSFSLRPFVYGTIEQYDEYQQLDYLLNGDQKLPVRFFVQGAPYKLFFLIPSTMHLFGVDPAPQSSASRTAPQGRAIFLLGTDEAGRDYFSRLLYGSQISLSVGLIAILITFTLGLTVGGVSGFYGGVLDDVIMRVCEIIMSVPQFYLLLALAAALPPTLPPITSYVLIISILAFVGWAGMARIVRGMVLSIRERPYVEAARSLGVSNSRIILRHVLPSTSTYAIVAATMSVPGYILGEAGLSFLGLGIRDPVPSWGNMLSAAQNLTTLESRVWILAPGLFIFITTLAFNFLGDGLRDALDPKSGKLG